MKSIQIKVDRTGIRFIIMLVYIIVSFYMFITFHSELSLKEQLFYLLDNNFIYLLIWVIVFSLLSFIFDYLIPKKEVVWCKVEGDRLIFYPNGPITFKKSFMYSDIDEIREIQKGIFKTSSIYIFLKSGKLYYLNAYKPGEVTRFFRWLKEAVPNILIKNLEKTPS